LGRDAGVAAERRGEADPADVAMLEDRILVLEGKPQQYGTQFDWDDDGVLNPRPIANPEDVDERRRAVGLGPLAEDMERIRADARNDGSRRPCGPQGGCRCVGSIGRLAGLIPSEGPSIVECMNCLSA
jgi:Family of unknown function (DUF6624)